MTRTPLRVAVCLAVLGCAPVAAQQPPSDPWAATAARFVDHLRTGAWAEAAAMVAPGAAAAAMGAGQLETIWGQLTAQVGRLGALAPGTVRAVSGYHVVDAPAVFERAELVVRVSLDGEGRVAGLFFPPAAPPPYVAPAYVDTAAFTEERLTLGADPWRLPAALALPVGEGPFPALVLVHGSGPNDMDETIGAHRPFRDLAWGLASAGVAVLRYDKRTRVHGARMQDVTLDDEVVTDALLALAAARAHPRVDGTRVALAGHSLGGLLGPRIAARDGRLAGLALLAAPARAFPDVLEEQLLYLAELAPDAAAAAPLLEQLEAVRRFRAGTLPDSARVIGASAAYLREVTAVDPVATAVTLDVPLLVLQGGRDYQVTMEDFARWQAGLATYPRAEFAAFAGLNHLFAPGEGRATPAEYSGPAAHVAPAVIARLADWVRGLGG